MDEVLTCMGSSALSEFRRRSLAQKIGASDVSAKYVHYVAFHEDGPARFLDEQRQILNQLLRYGDPIQTSKEADNDGNTTFFVSPRIGTISPWSSKATSIAWVCGFAEVIKRIERGTIITITGVQHAEAKKFTELLHDPMTEVISTQIPDLRSMFAEHAPASLGIIGTNGSEEESRADIEEANRSLGLALDASEIGYLVDAYAPGGPLSRPPTDVELFMFAQVNSEHCRHKQCTFSRRILFPSKI